MTKEELKLQLVNLFMEYGAVPQGYDFDLWSRERHEKCAKEFRWTDSFEDTVNRSVERMLLM